MQRSRPEYIQGVRVEAATKSIKEFFIALFYPCYAHDELY